MDIVLYTALGVILGILGGLIIGWIIEQYDNRHNPWRDLDK
jgi:F0F1-type ATP synthase assembly protein I